MSYETLTLEVRDHIANVVMNRPDAMNSMVPAFWREIAEAFAEINDNTDARVAVLSSTGKHFTAGLDFSVFDMFRPDPDVDPARQREQIRAMILHMQDSFSVIDNCRVPVLAAVHGACIGGGVDMISACDMRYCTADALFCIQEINLGVTADVGTLQRLPHIVPAGVMRDLAYTGRRMPADEARDCGLVNHVYGGQASMLTGVMEIAAEIASKSPLAVQGTKEMLNYARDHSVEDGLNFIATWQSGMLITDDVGKSMKAMRAGETAEYDNAASRIKVG